MPIVRVTEILEFGATLRCRTHGLDDEEVPRHRILGRYGKDAIVAIDRDGCGLTADWSGGG